MRFPRSFSASDQTMWPPSSGRNGNRFRIASASEKKPRNTSPKPGPGRDRFLRVLGDADHAVYFAARFELASARPRPETVSFKVPHIAASAPGGRAAEADGDRLAAEFEPHQRPCCLRVVPRVDRTAPRSGRRVPR